MEVEKQLAMCDNKIEKEIAQLLATYERYRNDVMKYAGGKTAKLCFRNTDWFCILYHSSLLRLRFTIKVEKNSGT